MTIQVEASRGRRLLVGVVALATFGAVAACSGGSGTPTAGYTMLPAQVGNPKAGGAITIALTPGLNPNYIYPYPPASQSGTVIARGQLWRPLYRPSGYGPREIDPALSLAEVPTYSPDRTTATIKLKRYQWSTGRPVSASDAVFSLALLKAGLAESPANWSFYTPGQFPDGVTAVATDPSTITLKLAKAYNPSYLLSVLELLYVMPSQEWNIARTGGPHLDSTQPANAKAIYDYLTKQAESQATYATNPLWKVVNGPFQLDSFDPTTGSYSLIPNRSYSGPGDAHLDKVTFKAFTSDAAVLNQYKAGTLDVGTLDSTFVSQIGDLEAKGYNVFGAPAPARIDPLTINFENTVGNFDKIAAQLYVRQALQHLIDQQGYINSRGVYNGAGSTNYTTAGADSPYPAAYGTSAPYPFDPAAATKLLTDHGWNVVPNGTTTCERPGTGPTHCGGGIPSGQAISFNLASANTPAYVGARDIAFASEAKKVGIKVTVFTKSLNYMYANYGNPYAPARKNDWAVQDYGPIYQAAGYPTSNTVFNTTGSFNLGSYSNPEADRLIRESTFGADPKALSKEITFLGTDLPVLLLPTPDTLVVWKKQLSGPPASFGSLLSFVYSPELWYLHS